MAIHVDHSGAELARLPQRKLEEAFGRDLITLWREREIDGVTA
jgi:hypothetical protein